MTKPYKHIEIMLHADGSVSVTFVGEAGDCHWGEDIMPDMLPDRVKEAVKILEAPSAK